jgi:hypothetical protein
MDAHPLERVTDMSLYQQVKQTVETSLLYLQARIQDVPQTLAKEVDGQNHN